MNIYHQVTNLIENCVMCNDCIWYPTDEGDYFLQKIYIYPACWADGLQYTLPLKQTPPSFHEHPKPYNLISWALYFKGMNPNILLNDKIKCSSHFE